MQLEHNIRYEAHYSIIVEALDHRLCIDTYNRFKYLIRAFNTPYLGQFSTSESKSARKGDVLKRELKINHTAYVSDILLFRQALHYIMSDYQYPNSPVKVSFYRAEVMSEERTFEVL